MTEKEIARAKMAELWLGAVYNTRGYAMTDEMWKLFSAFCEKHDFMSDMHWNAMHRKLKELEGKT